jgi:hypothetical protein
MYVLSVLVYVYLVLPSIKWLFSISPEQRLELVGLNAGLITYVSIAVLIAGLLSIVILVSQLLKKIEMNKWSDWGVRVLMINLVIEVLTFIILYVAISGKFMSLQISDETLVSAVNYNMYLNVILQIVSTGLILFGGVVAYKKGKTN